MRIETIKDILLYLLMPEDTTETGRPQGWEISRRAWLGPLKTLVWMLVAIASPLLICAL